MNTVVQATFVFETGQNNTYSRSKLLCILFVTETLNVLDFKLIFVLFRSLLTAGLNNLWLRPGGLFRQYTHTQLTFSYNKIVSSAHEASQRIKIIPE